MHSPHTWRKSSYSGDRNNCVEVADVPSGTAVRDSKNPHLAALAFPASEWQAFLNDIANAEDDHDTR